MTARFINVDLRSWALPDRGRRADVHPSRCRWRGNLQVVLVVPRAAKRLRSMCAGSRKISHYLATVSQLSRDCPTNTARGRDAGRPESALSRMNYRRGLSRSPIKTSGAGAGLSMGDLELPSHRGGSSSNLFVPHGARGVANEMDTNNDSGGNNGAVRSRLFTA
jgi:hypothetical protein